ncbi:hypothetical protein V1517DRAFT_356165 [Lipomyces orientalis]|uniref:Uncharacterized protein n=1 Tax=Lipomyces orientalis TaxID=1233043 RepID=A0ACC3TH01_9ASCO
MAIEGISIIVTGGCGNVGTAIVKHLQEQYPTATSTVLDLEKPEVSSSRFIEKVIYYAGNIADKASVNEVFETLGPVVVFHTTGLIPQIARRINMNNDKDHIKVNVQDTRNVFDAATAVVSVRALVFTSSIGNGDSGQDWAGVNESIAIPEM